MRSAQPRAMTSTMVTASWEEPLGPGQMERDETGEPTAPPLADQTGPRSWWKFRLVPSQGQGSPAVTSRLAQGPAETNR